MLPLAEQVDCSGGQQPGPEQPGQEQPCLEQQQPGPEKPGPEQPDPEQPGQEQQGPERQAWESTFYRIVALLEPRKEEKPDLPRHYRGNFRY